jgi:DNA polymerase-1
MAKLVLIDGHAILHRAFHALPPLTTKSGEPINAVYGLVSMLLKVIADLEPTHLAVCFDVKAPTFRHKAFKQYQSQRPPTHEDLSSQFEKAKRVVKAFGIPIYEKKGFEADDVIGTIAQQAIDEVVIVTGDRDLLQLVNHKVKLYMPVSGLSAGKLMGIEETTEKMGVVPGLIPDYKALVGDPSDNYAGVNGIGPKTAIDLLDKFGSVAGIYKNLKKIPPKTKEKLEKDKKSAELSHHLATIVKNVPVEFTLEACAKWKVDGQQVLDLFSEFGFKTLSERVKKVGKQLDQEKQMPLL